MTESFVQLPADGSGKKLRTFQQTVGQNVVEHQAVVLVDSAGNVLASIPVTVGNFPATQTVAGTVAVSNLPATQPVSGTFWPATQPVSGTVTANAGTGTMAVSAASLPLPSGAAQEHSTASSPSSARLSDGTSYLGTTAGRLQVADGGVALSVTGPLTDTQLRSAAVAVSGPLTDTQLRASAVNVSASGTVAVSNLQSAPLNVTATGAAAAGVTLTLPAAGANLFHYICALEITAYSTVARTGSATPVLVTTTNLAGNPAYTFASAAAIGTTDRYMPLLAAPVKSSTANTATTIVAPATASVIWRINVAYYTGT